jgi:biopolymer transport protein ExbD/biopolymer transport protein TolR
MGMDVGAKAGGVKSDINVTPLVDIVLVLLIIFIVITPAVNNAVKLPLAKHSVKPETEVGKKYLSLMLPSKRDPQDYSKVIGAKPVEIDDREAQDKGIKFNMESDEGKKSLVSYIQSYTRELADKRVFIKADADLPFKYVNVLFQLCREGGADEASIVTSEDKGKEKEGGQS